MIRPAIRYIVWSDGVKSEFTEGLPKGTLERFLVDFGQRWENILIFDLQHKGRHCGKVLKGNATLAKQGITG